ncbi:MAG TPA: sodium:glutamate symporter, partial [Clostridia bacterium]
GVLGLVIMIALAATIMPGLFRAGGLLLPMGYGQGPGQANNIGSLYEYTYGFVGGTSFGLGIATLGLLWACIGGIIYLNILVRKGKLTMKKVDSPHDISAESVADEGEIPLVEAVDKFTIQIALVAFVYLLCYLLSMGMIALLGLFPGLAGLQKTIAPLIWGFNFIIGSSLALALRGVFAGLRKSGLMTRQYPNNYLLNRISGFAFDLMIVASISAINIGDLKGLWVPFLLLTTIGGFLTLFYCRWVADRIYPEYPVEGMISMYGMMTGTVSTAILLLREVDPNFRTPAANNLITGSSAAIVIGFPLLVMIGLAPQSTAMLWLTVGLAAAYAIVINIVMLRRTGRREKAAAKPTEDEGADCAGKG